MGNEHVDPLGIYTLAVATKSLKAYQSMSVQTIY